MAMALAARRGSEIWRAMSGIRHTQRRTAIDFSESDMFGKMREGSDRIVIDGHSEESFSVDKVEYHGSIICLGTFVLSWTPTTFEQITPESISFLDLLTPTPDILVLGTGNVTKFPSKEVKEFLRSRGIKIESVDSRHGAIAFNYMNVEHRAVVAAMLPCGIEPPIIRY